MRGLVPELPTPFPLGSTLPGLYHADTVAQSLCTALDEVLAPIVMTIDGLTAYLDPDTTPADMLGWLASWLGLTLDDNQPAQRQRELVRQGVELLRWRGTARGVRDAVAAAFGSTPTLQETGGASWSSEPGARLPGSAPARLVVRMDVSDPDDFDVRRLDALVTAVKPAHIPHEVRVQVLSAG